jgi:hypothetical protein
MIYGFARALRCQGVILSGEGAFEKSSAQRDDLGI